jgi:hypothetical protein
VSGGGAGNGVGCTRTQGYWKNHHEFAKNKSQRKDWPAPQDESALLCSKSNVTMLEYFGIPVKGNAFLNLAHQYMAAKLNVAAGAFAPPQVVAALEEASDLLRIYCGESVSSSSSVGQRMVQLAGILDAFNNGRLGTPHCD